jgi:ATP-dependent DNA helicase UvrD/PcrA
MASVLDGLTDTQRDAVAHAGGPLLVIGGAGTGKTEVLVRRLAWLADQGTPPHRILVLSAQEDLAPRLEAALDRPHEDLALHTATSLCAALLGAEAVHAGIDPFVEVVGGADRLAMLLERGDELELARHDFRGRPSALFASFIRRIDRLRAELVDPEAFAVWAGGRHAEAADRDREFAGVFAAHDRMLAERGVHDEGGVVAAAVALLGRDPAVRERAAARHPALLVDDWQDRTRAERALIAALEAGGSALSAAGDDDQAVGRSRGAGARNLQRFIDERPDARLVALGQGFRCGRRVLEAAEAVVAAISPRIATVPTPASEDAEVRFWRAANDRAQAQRLAAELERLTLRDGVPAERCAVLVDAVAEDGQAVAAALAERAVPARVLATEAFFDRTEVRDVLAWLRLLVDPRDAAAVVRALGRPPIELPAADIARCVQIARRRRIDMVSALVAATESPQLAPEARERVSQFLAVHRAAADALSSAPADLFVHQLIEQLGLRRNQLFTARADVVERLLNLARLGELAGALRRRVPGAGGREFARYLTVLAEAGLGEPEALPPGPARAVVIAPVEAVAGLQFEHVFVLGCHARRPPGRGAHVPRDLAPDGDAAEQDADDRARHRLHVASTRASRSVTFAYAESSPRGARRTPSPLVEEARRALGLEWEECAEELFGPDEALQSIFRERRDELLASIARLGTRLGELRFDTDLDVTHGIARYLELVKLAALVQRREEQPLPQALEDLNARLAAAVTPLQREVLASSPLDELLLGAARDARARAAAFAAPEQPSLEAFLPRRGEGLVLSASDVETYLTCPLRYKFARVLRIPREPTLNQRFGIFVHQVLERFHGTGGGGSEEMLRLLDSGWRRGGFSDSDEERQLREKARVALLRYQRRLGADGGDPRWFERSFLFPLGRHHIRGRVDRVDALACGGYELIDYKTGVPKRADQLREDVQLALYAVAAREAWHVEATERTYYYVLDDERVRLGVDDDARGWVEDTVAEVGAGIMAQGFEPTPSHAVCAMCEYRIACPAAEK